MELTPVQVRVLGCLLEKEQATPDNYPLTMNGLLLACNQTTNRVPVVSYNEPTVSNALANLRAGNLVRVVYSRSNRAEKYRHVLDEALDLGHGPLALLSVLMVRGPQTVAELRTRSERLHRFDSFDEVEATLGELAGRAEPLVVRLGRAAGQKEDRWAQLLAGPVTLDDLPPPPEPSRAARPDRMAGLEAAVEALRAEVEHLRAQHDALVERLGDLVD